MISYRTRSRKLRVVTDHLGFFHPLDLLRHYQDREIVPGICPACGADTVESILILSGMT